MSDAPVIASLKSRRKRSGVKIARSIFPSALNKKTAMYDVGRNHLSDDALPREAGGSAPVYWERGRKMLLWVLLWMLALPMGMFGFFSMLLWAYGVDG